MTRRERLERKLEKRREWANKRTAESSRRFDTAHNLVKDIPMGQPILVGHHSEKRHRRTLERHDQNMRKGFEASEMASHHTSKAGGLESMLDNSIFSDDPDALDRLEERIQELEALREFKKKANSAFKKAKGQPGWANGLGLAEDEARKLENQISNTMALMPYINVPFPSYNLTNLGANIR